MFEKLFESTNDELLDDLTCKALEYIFYAIIFILEKNCQDQLDGGKFAKPSEKLKSAAAKVPAHNKVSESEFGMQGDILRSKPNANVDTIGTIIMIKKTI